MSLLTGSAEQALEMFGGLDALRDLVQKSMEAGYPNPMPYEGGGSLAPLMVQDIDTVLKVATFDMAKIKLIKRIPKPPYQGKSTIHEFTIQDSYGPQISTFTTEGTNGPLIDAAFTRVIAKCKYMAHVRTVTEVAGSITNIIGAANAFEKADKDAAIYHAANQEHATFYGDDRYEPGSIQGMKQAAEEADLVDGQHVIDMAGEYVDTDKIHDLVSTLCDAPNYGSPDCIYMPVKIKNDIGKVLGSHVRINQNMQGGLLGKTGVEATGTIGPEGDVPYETSTFLSPEKRRLTLTTAVGDSSLRPPTPTIDTEPAVGAGSSGPLWLSTDVGVYLYKFVAVGGQGQSAPVATAAVTAEAGKKITFKINSNERTTCYKVYRTEAGGSDFYEILTVPQTFDTDGVTPLDTTVTDLNAWRPNTGVIFITQHTPDVMGWHQLLPYTRYPLARTSPQRPTLYMMFGMNIFPIKKRIGMIKNVKMNITTTA